MLGPLALLFLVVPLAELYVLIQVSHHVGVGTSLLLLVLVSVVGAWLTKHAGLGVLRRLQLTVSRGQIPSNELVDGFLVLFAGALLLTPGFITDALALVLLAPPTRAAVRSLLIRRIKRGTTWFIGVRAPGTAWPAGAGDHDGSGGVWDVEGWESEARRPGGELDPPDRGPGR
jgi:UPF0716 protein FxsA